MVDCKPAKAQRKRIVALGELLIDLIPERENMRICEAGSVVKTASGSAGIFACAAALLGAESGFVGKVGPDSLSRLAVEAVRAQGVDLSGLVLADSGQLGLGFLEYLPEGRNYQYYRQDSVGSRLRPEELDESYIASAYAVHFPGMLLSLTPELRASCLRLVELAQKHGVLLSFDPNIRQELLPDSQIAAAMREVIARAQIMAPTLREGQLISGKESLGEVLFALHEMGPRVVALTRDKDGVVISDGQKVALAPGIDEKALDPTGAGDALAAALCVGLQEGMALAELANFCNCTGTLVVKKRGAIGMALPSRAEVEKLMTVVACEVECLPFAQFCARY